LATNYSRSRPNSGDEPGSHIEKGVHQELIAKGGYFSNLYNSRFIFYLNQTGAPEKSLQRHVAAEFNIIKTEYKAKSNKGE